MDVHNIRYGYNLADLDRLAHAAVAAAHAQAMDYLDRYDAAWHAVVEALYTSTERPEPWELKRAGMNAVNRAAQDHGRAWGRDRNGGTGFETARGWLRYWELERRAAPSPEDLVIDRTALWQIWPHLSDTHRQVLLALAAHGDQRSTAGAIGKTYATTGTHLKDARRRFFELWHEGETPSRLWGKTGPSGRRTAAQTLVNRRQQRARRAAASGEAR